MKPQGVFELRCFCGKKLGEIETGDRPLRELSSPPIRSRCRDCKKTVRFVLTAGKETKEFIQETPAPQRAHVSRMHLQ